MDLAQYQLIWTRFLESGNPDLIEIARLSIWRCSTMLLQNDVPPLTKMYFQSLSEFTSEKCIYTNNKVSELKHLLDKLFSFGNSISQSSLNQQPNILIRPALQVIEEPTPLSQQRLEENKQPLNEKYLKVNFPEYHRSKPQKFKMEDSSILISIGSNHPGQIHHIAVPNVESLISIYYEANSSIFKAWEAPTENPEGLYQIKNDILSTGEVYVFGQAEISIKQIIHPGPELEVCVKYNDENDEIRYFRISNYAAIGSGPSNSIVIPGENDNECYAEFEKIQGDWRIKARNQGDFIWKQLHVESTVALHTQSPKIPINLGTLMKIRHMCFKVMISD
ncbi:unnamed protein product [Blepharisma stoltei]|uniref:Uncharacterized protein n=1 Tax=Blepharisma stoltei TaxID=1481888 RepID=A0AAU9KIF5_9CILI|nr:unnamed protein product [Blepharisma stoltei]